MLQPPPLDDRELDAALAELPGWEATDGALRRTLTFKDFSRAFAFMTAAALVAERLDHHPTWTNTFGTLTIELRTHASDAITARDTELALRLEQLRSEPPWASST